jgi:hypothetical protein
VRITEDCFHESRFDSSTVYDNLFKKIIPSALRDAGNKREPNLTLARAQNWRCCSATHRKKRGFSEYLQGYVCFFPLLGIFCLLFYHTLVSFPVYALCGLQCALCGLQCALCGLQLVYLIESASSVAIKSDLESDDGWLSLFFNSPKDGCCCWPHVTWVY